VSFRGGSAPLKDVKYTDEPVRKRKYRLQKLFPTNGMAQYMR